MDKLGEFLIKSARREGENTRVWKSVAMNSFTF